MIEQPDILDEVTEETIVHLLTPIGGVRVLDTTERYVTIDWENDTVDADIDGYLYVIPMHSVSYIRSKSKVFK